MAEGAPLLREYAVIPYRGFESLPLRHYFLFVPLAARTPHNFHLQIIFDTGFIGAGLLLLTLLWPIWHLLKTGQTQTALCILLPLGVMMGGTLFNFVIWRTWIPGATILSIFFLYLSAAQTGYQR